MTARFPLLLLALLLACTSLRADCLFVNTNSDPNTVAAFVVNADGSLTPVAGSPFATGGSGVFDAAVGSVGLCVSGSRLYVSNPSSDNVSGFAIASDCSLSATPGSPYAAGSRALGLEPDVSGNFLYVANFLGDSISVFAIAGDGSLTPITGSPFATPSTPFDIVFDPAGGRFFVSHDFAGAVGAYDQAGDGTFTPVAGSPFPAGGFEHGLALDAAGSRIYAADFGPDTITGYSIAGNGVLSALPGSPYAATVEPIELLVHPSGSFLYATNDNAENIAGFSVDGSGDLTPLAGSPFASDSVGPAGLAQNPGGSIVYVANGGFSGNPDVSAFAVAGDGSLSPITGSPFATGGTGNATGIAYLSQLDLEVSMTESVDPVIAGSGPQNLSYVVTVANNSASGATGVELTVDGTRPAGVSLVSSNPSAGSFAGTTWTVGDLPVSSSQTLTLLLTVDETTAPGNDVIDNTATLSALNEGDGNASNNSVTLATSVVSPARVSATKEVSGQFEVGGTVIYTVTLINNSAAPTADNAGDEFVDVLPSELALVSAQVTVGGGTAVANVGANTVTWNGSIAGGGTVVISIESTVTSAMIPGQRISNQADVFFDSNGDGQNDASVPSDDPGPGGSDDSTDFRLLRPLDIPTLGPWGIGVLLLLLASASWRLLSGRRVE